MYLNLQIMSSVDNLVILNWEEVRILWSHLQVETCCMPFTKCLLPAAQVSRLNNIFVANDSIV